MVPLFICFPFATEICTTSISLKPNFFSSSTAVQAVSKSIALMTTLPFDFSLALATRRTSLKKPLPPIRMASANGRLASASGALPRELRRFLERQTFPRCSWLSQLLLGLRQWRKPCLLAPLEGQPQLLSRLCRNQHR